uniref:Uncharacterized protein n=1 Tax=Spongospora subterranea TaxID=70186 RepID=A0A0H5QY98_9EUKA|eukprot:CRZ00559.1 hypothetical protein [Spongospora subterranea]
MEKNSSLGNRPFNEEDPFIEIVVNINRISHINIVKSKSILVPPQVWYLYPGKQVSFTGDSLKNRSLRNIIIVEEETIFSDRVFCLSLALENEISWCAVKVEVSIVMASSRQICRRFKEKEMEEWKRKRKGEDEI